MDTYITKVLIVDDELPIREELKAFPWEKYGCILVGEAANGQKALELCLKKFPDIVIADITMPVMDGLELIVRLKEKLPQTKFIILTCHKDFEYAKKAIESNAVDYLLKLDLRETEISRAIQKAREEIINDKAVLIDHAISERVEILKCFVSMKQGKETDETMLREKLNRIGLSSGLSDKSYFMIFERSGAFPAYFEAEIQRYLIMYPLINNWIMLDSGIYAIVWKGKTEVAIRQFVSGLQRKIDSDPVFVPNGIRFYLVVTDTIHNITEYSKIFEKENVWRGNWFYHPSQSVFIDKEMRPLKNLDALRKEQLFMLFGNGEANAEHIDTLLKDWAVSHFIWPSQLKNIVSQYLLKKSEKEVSQMPVSRICSATDIDELSSFVKYIFSIGKGRKNYRYEIRKAIQIIKEEYASPISLSYVAEKVNLSTQYLSKLFSEEVGERFNDFVTRVRMENAQRFILNSDLKVYQIAERVGIPNYRYFSFLYKKWFAKSPKESKSGYL